MAGLLDGLGQGKGCGETHSQRVVIIGRLEELADEGILNNQTIDAAYRADSICSEEADYYRYRIGRK